MLPKHGVLPRIDTAPGNGTSKPTSSRPNLAAKSHSPPASLKIPSFGPGQLMAGDAPIPLSPMVIPPTPHPIEEDERTNGVRAENRDSPGDSRAEQGAEVGEVNADDGVKMESPEGDDDRPSDTSTRSHPRTADHRDSGKTVRQASPKGSTGSPVEVDSPSVTSPPQMQQSPIDFSSSPTSAQNANHDLGDSPVEMRSPTGNDDSHGPSRPPRRASVPNSAGTGWRFQRGRVRSSWMNGSGEDRQDSADTASSGRQGEESENDASRSPDPRTARSPSPPHRTPSTIEVDGSEDESESNGKESGDPQPVAQIFSAISTSPMYEDGPARSAAADAATVAPPASQGSGGGEKNGAKRSGEESCHDDSPDPHLPQTYPHPAAHHLPGQPYPSTSFSPYKIPRKPSSNQDDSKNASSPPHLPRTPRPNTPRPQGSMDYNLHHGQGHGTGTFETARSHKHTHAHVHSRTRSPGKTIHGQTLSLDQSSGHRRSSSTHRVLETLNARQHSDSEGRRMVNQYALGPLIGRGAYGNVEKAIDVGTGEEYAIKEFSKSRLKRQKQLSDVARQRRARGGLLPPAHPVESDRKSPGEVGGKDVGKDGRVDPSERAKAERAKAERAKAECAESEPKSEEHSEPKNEDALALIRREVAVMKKLDHPNLVLLYEAIDVPPSDSLYLVIEYLPGGTLMEIHVDGRSSTPIPMETARDYFRQLVLGLEYLHENDIAHRDIKPDNILLSADRRTIKLCDFGVSEMFSAGDDRMHKSAGSPAFMSPEAAIANKVEVHAQPVDIWATGIVLFCMHRGRLPFSAHTPLELYEAIKDSPVQVPREWDPDLKRLITRLLTKDPAERIKMPELREHPWLTDNGAWPMPSTEENLYEIGALVEDPTQDEISKAFTSVRGVFTVIRAVQKMRRAALLRKSGRTSPFGSSGRSSPMVSSPASESAPSSRPQDSSMDDYMCGSGRQFQSPFSSASSRVVDSPSTSPMALQAKRNAGDDDDVDAMLDQEVSSPKGMTEEEDRKAPKMQGIQKKSPEKSQGDYFGNNR